MNDDLFFYPKIIESSERHISLVVGVSAGAETALTQDVAEAEAAGYRRGCVRRAS